MMNCREITRLASADHLQDMGLMKRLEFRMHLLMCVHCRRYVRQIQALGLALRRAFSPATNQELEDRIVRACRASGDHPTS